MSHSQQHDVETVKNIACDPRMESYQSFFDQQWVKELLDTVQWTALDPIAMDLCADWRGVANTCAMPGIWVGNLHGFQQAFLSNSTPYGRKHVGRLTGWVLREMGDDLSNMKRKKLKQVLKHIYEQLADAVEQVRSGLTEEKIWALFMDQKEFKLCIWGSQRISYGALYYAYENFVRRCLALIVGENHAQQRDFKKFHRTFTEVYGPDLAQHCLADECVVTARHVRNSLVHHGGAETPELEGREHGIFVEDGRLQIMAPDVKALADVLKGRVLALAKETVGLLGRAAKPK